MSDQQNCGRSEPPAAEVIEKSVGRPFRWADDLHAKGLLPAGKYAINID